MGIYDRDWYRPTRPGLSLRRTSVVTILIAINVACFVLQIIALKGFRWNLVGVFGMWPQDVVGKLKVWQILTSMFLHSVGSPLHLIFNMFLLWMLGRPVEARLGRRPFLRLYLGSGLLAGIAYVVIGQFTEPFLPAVGASGAVMGVIVYFTFLAPNTTVLLFFVIPMKIKWVTIGFLALDFYLFVLAGSQGTGIAHTAHLGGALFGLLYWRYAHRVDRFFTDLEIRGRARAAAGGARREADLEIEVDRLLDKIREDGIHSLSEKERRFLREASERLRRKR